MKLNLKIFQIRNQILIFRFSFKFASLYYRTIFFLLSSSVAFWWKLPWTMKFFCYSMRFLVAQNKRKKMVKMWHILKVHPSTWGTWLLCARKFRLTFMIMRYRYRVSFSSFFVSRAGERHEAHTLIENKCVSGVWSKNIVRRTR